MIINSAFILLSMSVISHLADGETANISCFAVALKPIAPRSQKEADLNLSSSVSIKLSGQAEAESLWVTASYILRGDCSKLVRSYEANRVVLSNGSALSIPRSGGALVPTAAPIAELRRPHVIPRVPGSIFAAAALVDQTSSGIRYIGAWKSGSKTLLATFVDGSDDAPKPLATINAEVTGLTYFPAPDIAAGSIGLVQEAGATQSVASVSWYHHNWTW